MAKSLTVWWNGDVVGKLVLNQYGEPEFTYAGGWLARTDAKPVSASLPLQPEPFGRRVCLPFFEGLLPEASQRTAVARVLGISELNEFRLLEKLGGEVAGAIEIWPEEVRYEGVDSSRPGALTENEIIALINHLPTRPMLAGNEYGYRHSLAGAQSKLPVVSTDGDIALPVPGQPTTHILKPEIERIEGTTENEAFCMRLGTMIGLDVANIECRSIGDKRFLLIERYDRQVDEEGHIKRLHQEDFCQALGIISMRKSASDGGPVFRDCFDLLRRVTTRPAKETLSLLDAALYNAVIGNADAHGKNFSLLYHVDRTELAPLYDLLSTVAYPDLSQRFSMKIGGRSTLEELHPGDFDKFAKDIRIRAPFIRQRLGEIANSILEQAEKAISSLKLPNDRVVFATTFGNRIQVRARAVLKMLGHIT